MTKIFQKSVGSSFCNANINAYCSFSMNSEIIIRIRGEKGWHSLQEKEEIFLKDNFSYFFKPNFEKNFVSAYYSFIIMSHSLVWILDTYCFAGGRCLFKKLWSVIYHWNQYNEISKKCRVVCLFVTLTNNAYSFFITISRIIIRISGDMAWHPLQENEVIFMSHSLLWRYIVLLTVGVYSSNHRVLYTIGISMTRRFQKSVGPCVRLSVCNATKKSLLLLHYWQ